MAFRVGANSSNNARAKSTDAIVDAIDVGSTNSTGRLLIYSGSQPATPETAATGTLLATINFANPAFGNADSSGVANLAGSTAISATITTSGTAGWFRVLDRNNNPILDGSIGTSGADMNFSDVSFISGGTVTISSLAIATPM